MACLRNDSCNMFTCRISGLALPRTLSKFPSYANSCTLTVLSNQKSAESSQPGPKVQGFPKYKALLVDAGGTLLQLAGPIEETYAMYGVKYGVQVSRKEIKEGFKKAFADPWPKRLRYEGDGKPFWRHVVAMATGCKEEGYFEELYHHFSKAAAWKLPSGAISYLNSLKDSGVKLGVISNFDSRLRPLLEELNIAKLFHSIIVSSEVGYEKPAPQIFEAALSELKVRAKDVVLLGDDPIADKEGARAVGIDSWLWKKEVNSFEELADKILESKGNWL